MAFSSNDFGDIDEPVDSAPRDGGLEAAFVSQEDDFIELPLLPSMLRGEEESIL